jgi:16S rRNA (cytosine1402-N4)-methyltransferase
LAILEKIGPKGCLVGVDRDEDALNRARSRLATWEKQCVWVHGNYGEIRDLLRAREITRVDGVLLDLGLSLDQLDAPERGFSFMKEGLLDMRMDRSQGRTAKELLNRLTEAELCSLLRSKGEEPRARQIAHAIVKERERRPITTTSHLATLISEVTGGRRGRLHPATRSFQALRLAVNEELEWLEKGLTGAVDLLGDGGRLAVISFHSLEDRIVKRFFVRHVGRWESLQEGGQRWIGALPRLALVNRKPVPPSEDEVELNPCSRSAKLRVVEKIAG